MCNTFDIVCIQEHWLLPNDINHLSNLHTDFFAVGQSAVNLADDILVGKPYGGTGILYKRSLGQLVSVVDTNNARITAVTFTLSCGPVLLVSAYFPTDYGDNDSLDSFIETCAAITAIYEESEAIQIVVAGDFNCHVGSRYYRTLLSFTQDNRLQLTDINRLSNVYTFCSDATSSVSWIDHILYSDSLDTLVTSCNVLSTYVSSDHKPLYVTLDSVIPPVNTTSLNYSSAPDNYILDWSNCNNHNIQTYRIMLDDLLCYVNVHNTLFGNGSEENYNYIVDDYYNAIMECIKIASRTAIPSRMCNNKSIVM